MTMAQVSRVLNMGYAAGKAQLSPGVAWTIEKVVLSGGQAQASKFAGLNCVPSLSGMLWSLVLYLFYNSVLTQLCDAV